MAKVREAKDPCNATIAWARGILASSATLPKAPAKQELDPSVGTAAERGTTQPTVPAKEAASTSQKERAKETEANPISQEEKDGARRALAAKAKARAMAKAKEKSQTWTRPAGPT